MAHPVELIHPRSLKHLSGKIQALLHNRLWLQVLVAMLLGIGAGIALGPGAQIVDQDTASSITDWIALPGRFFLVLIQMIVVPLVFASIIRGLAGGESSSQLKRLGFRLVLFFVMTTALASVIGIGSGLLINPGQYVDPDLIGQLVPDSQPSLVTASDTPTRSIPDMIVTLLPANPLGAMLENQMLQIVLLSLVVGLAMISMAPKQSKPLLELFGSIQTVCMTIVRWAMLLAPFAVFGLLAQVTSKVGFEALIGMSAYVGAVLLGLLALMGVYLVIVFLFARMSPTRFVREVSSVQLVAFSTSSSAAVMPLSLKTAEEKLKVAPSLAQVIIPLGATMNMAGTAVYQGVATIFLAQVFGVELELSKLTLVVATSVAASIGSPAAPGAGIVILAMILKTAGIPETGIALIIGVDRILDMSRTSVNVTGDLVACAVMQRWVGTSEPEEKLNREVEKRQQEREQSGADVIVDEV